MFYLIDTVLLIVIYFLFFYKKWLKQEKDLFIMKTLFYIYICLVLYVTLMPFPILFFRGDRDILNHINLIPFRDIRMSYHGAVKEALLNVLMLIPFGFILPIIKKMNIFKVIIYSFITSLTIESIQLLYWLGGSLTYRSFDVTDMITNTIGGLLGYLLYLLFKPFINYIMDRIKSGQQ